MLAGYWLVADMDGCLTPTPTKAHGQYLPLSSSPTHRHLLRFIELGGSLCVVSTAGRRMWRQVLQELRPALFPALGSASIGGNTNNNHACIIPSVPGRFALCALSGAVCFLSDSTSQSVKRVESYAVAYEPSTGTRKSETLLEGNMAEWAQLEGRAAVVRFFELAAHLSGGDIKKAREWFASCLSRKYVEPYTQLLENMLAEASKKAAVNGSSSPSFVKSPCFEDSEYLRMEHLTLHGKYIHEPKDALVDVQCVPCDDGTLPSNASSNNILESSSSIQEAAQISVLGIPMSLYHDIFFPIETPSSSWSCPHCESGAKAKTALQEFQEHGLVCKSQPNSVCIARAKVDKGVCVRWLIEQGKSKELDFDLTRAIAFGDVPSAVDKPLTEFPPMPFVSLSMNPECDPSGLVHVGGEEEGTALFLEELLDSITFNNTENSSEKENYFSLERVKACAARAKERLEASKAIETPATAAATN